MTPVRTKRIAQRHVLVGITAEFAQGQTQAFFVLHQTHAHLQGTRLGLDQLIVAARIMLHDHAQVVDDAVVALQVALLDIQQLLVAQGSQVLFAHQHGQVFLGFANFFAVVFLVQLVTTDLRADGPAGEQVDATDQGHRIRGIHAAAALYITGGLHAYHRPVAGSRAFRLHRRLLFTGTGFQHRGIAFGGIDDQAGQSGRRRSARPEHARHQAADAGTDRRQPWLPASRRCLELLAHAQRSRSACFRRVIGLTRYWKMVFSPVRISTEAIMPGMMGMVSPFLSRSVFCSVWMMTR